jgi:magnesium-transporting ATPase (P-type)
MYKLAVSFSDWQWLFTDVCWTVTFALTLPLAKPADILSKARPTISLLSLQTAGGAVGIIALNWCFTGIAYSVLYKEDWYHCRKWELDDVQAGSILSASDNYEISVLFLMVGIQLIAATAALNFGYEYRQAWYRNYIFAAIWSGFFCMHIFITLYPGSLSCLWRINCDNDHVVRGVLSAEPSPIGNPYNTTIMPIEFRLKLLAIMMANFLAVLAYEYLIVNGVWQRKRALKELAQPQAASKNGGSTLVAGSGV